MKMRFIKFFSLLAAISLTGCIITHVKGFTDRNFEKYHLTKMAVRAPNASFMFGELLEKSMVSALRDKGVQAESFMAIFPPTRKWTHEQVAVELTQKGFDTIMYVNLTGSESRAETVGYINNGNASVYGNTATFNSVSLPVTGRSRYTATRITIYDITTAHTIWVGDSTTHAGGLLYIGDETQTDNIAKEVTDSLVKSGHL